MPIGKGDHPRRYHLAINLMLRNILSGMRLLPLYLLMGCFVATGMASANEASSSNEGDTGKFVLRATRVQESSKSSPPPSFTNAERLMERKRMVRHQISARGVDDSKVLDAMRDVPRHLLVPESLRKHAYKDRPLPIGHGQTISQPYIVGYMTELLRIGPEDTVLEIGTGSGYQAAILAQLAREVITIEIIEALANRAAEDLQDMGYQNISVLHGDGYFGYETQAPYDAIIVTAAAEHIPPPLIAQLKPGGRMILPVGSSGWTQNLILVKKNSEGKVRTRNLLPVRFVPLTRKER